MSRHRHHWAEQSRHFTGERHLTGAEARQAFMDMVERLLFGVTVVILGCTECGDLTEREFLGNALKEADR